MWFAAKRAVELGLAGGRWFAESRPGAAAPAGAAGDEVHNAGNGYTKGTVVRRVNDAQSPLQARLGAPAVYKVFNVLFAVLFAGTVVLTVFFNLDTFFAFSWYWLLLAAVLGCLLYYLLGRLFSMLPPPSRAAEVAIMAVVLAAYAALQGYFGWTMRVAPGDSWDFGIVHTAARDYVLDGTLNESYFRLFPNNIGIYTLLCGYFSFLHLFGVTDFTLPSIILNILAIDGALVMLYLCGRRLFGVQKAFFLAFTAVATLPFLTYTPIAYTDTLTLPFPVGAVLLWLSARAHWRAGAVKKAVVRLCIIGLMAALGALLKMTVLIIFIAILCDLLFLLRGKGRVRALLAAVAITAAVLAGGSFALRHSPLVPLPDKDDTIPAAHWVMMGLRDVGGYSEEDYQATLSYPDTEARQAFAEREIVQRLARMGPLGFLKHLAVKMSYTFGDGTYTAPYKLNQGARAVAPGHNFFIADRYGFQYIAYYSFAVEAAMLFWLAIASVKAFIRKNDALGFVRIALFGLTLFLMLWETRARYLVNFLPLFLLCAAEAIPTPFAHRRRVARAVAGAGEGLPAGDAPPVEAGGAMIEEAQQREPAAPPPQSTDYIGDFMRAQEEKEQASSEEQPKDLFALFEEEQETR